MPEEKNVNEETAVERLPAVDQEEITIKMDVTRLQNMLTVGDIMDAENGQMPAMMRVLSVLVYNEETDTYTDPEKAMQTIRKIPVWQLSELGAEIFTMMNQEAGTGKKPQA